MRYVFASLGTKLCACAAVVVALNACSSSSSSSGGSSTGANVFGQVSQSTTVADLGAPVLQAEQGGSFFTRLARFKPGKGRQKLAELAVSGCTVTATDLLTNGTVSTAQSASDGTYTLTGVTAGESYKITAACGADKFTSVAKADTVEPSSKDPEITSPVSTIIAAKIIEAVLSAIETTVSGLGLTGNAAAAVKAAVVSSLDSVIASIKTTIETAIQTGQMEAPSVSEASSIAGGLEVATNSTAASSATTTFEATKPIPASVTQTIDGAKGQVSALAACDSTKNGTLVECTKSVARIMYSGLNFGVALDKNTTTGAFGTLINNDCSSSNTALAAEFKNATFQDGSGIFTGFCLISPSLGEVNRNRAPDEYGGGGGGMFFTETGIGGSTNTGVIDAIGSSLFAGNAYRLSNLDSIVFSYSGTATMAGMNARLFGIDSGTGGGGNGATRVFYYKNIAGSWAEVPSISWQDSSQFCNGGGNYCNVTESNNSRPTVNIPFGTTALTWSPSDLSSTLITGTASFSTFLTQVNGASFSGVMQAMYGGSVPSIAQLDEFFDERTHVSSNPTGRKRFYGIYSMQMAMSGTAANGCNDIGSTETCYGVDGTPFPVMRVNIAYGTTNLTTKTRMITSVAANGSGAFMMRPFYNSTGFSGVIGFTRISDGKVAQNELMQERAVKIVLNTGECNQNGLPTTGAGCALGDWYNVNLDWSNCNGSTGCPEYTAISEINTKPSLAIQTNYRMMPMFVSTGSASYSVWVAGIGDMNGMTPLTVNWGTMGAGNNPLTPSSSGTHYIGAHYACSSACTLEGFYLINATNGSVVTQTNDADGTTMTTSVCGVSGGFYSCGISNAIKYSVSQLDTYGNFPGTSKTFSQNTENKYVFNGPWPNPNWRCDGEPFFLDGNSNNQLDCDPANAGQVLASSTDISFSNVWDYQRWYNDPNVSGSLKARPLRTRQNGYRFGDPIAAKKLLTTAFNGWFDGTKSITATTNMDALQMFSLVFLMFTQEGGVSFDTTGMGVPSSVYDFALQMPMDTSTGGGPEQAIVINKLLGNGLLQFKQ